MLFLMFAYFLTSRLFWMNRKVQSSCEPRVSFEKNNENQTRTATPVSPIYEAVDGETNVVSGPAQSGQTNSSQPDYENTPQREGVNQEDTNDYDKLDVDVIGEGSPYNKIEV